jgi:hypothetical protein
VDIGYDPDLPHEMFSHGYDRRRHRLFASWIEQTHTFRTQGLIGAYGLIRPNVVDEVLKVLRNAEGLLIYANHATVAEAMSRTFEEWGIDHGLVTGSTPKRRKADLIDFFRFGKLKVLIGTASLATGTDGMDRVCDTLLILDDTDDDALRRQLIGRILPRGDMAPWAHKSVLRLVPDL